MRKIIEIPIDDFEIMKEVCDVARYASRMLVLKGDSSGIGERLFYAIKAYNKMSNTGLPLGAYHDSEFPLDLNPTWPNGGMKPLSQNKTK